MAHKVTEIIQAFEAGKDIQFKPLEFEGYNVWRDLKRVTKCESEPELDFSRNAYRIKPKLIICKKIKVRAYTFKEANDIMKKLLSYGYEGVQNDSYRYCELGARSALRSGVCYICVNAGAWCSSMRVSCAHDKTHKNYLEVSKSRFFELAKIVNKDVIIDKCFDKVVFDCELGKIITIK